MRLLQKLNIWLHSNTQRDGPQNTPMDTQKYKERILESENLTADLEDSEADWLLQWGIAQIASVTAGLTDEALADEKISALMAFMRRAARSVARKDRHPPEELAEDLSELGNFYAQAFGNGRLIAAEDYHKATTRLRTLPTLEALQFIVTWYAPESSAT